MKNDIAFTVYNAAAGAGKTYTLVKEYLSTLLSAPFKDGYKNILAITFTNKAVAEMKTRILENLVAISNEHTPVEYQEILKDLVSETKIPEEEIKKKAERILKSILHNYAAFDIVTIDTFTHRVLRTFAYDLGIPINFEIEMDTETLIKEAIDAVVSQIGIDHELTQLIINFAFGKLEEDKSWDITVELNKTAKLLFSENDRAHLNLISNKTIGDFEALKKILSSKITAFKKEITTVAKNTLHLIEEKGIIHTDFQRGSIPAHFKKLLQGDSKVDFKAAWKQDIQNASFYGVKLDEFKKAQIDDIRHDIENAFLVTKKQILQIQFFKNCIKNLTPLSVLNTINKELQEIKKERRILLISEFNSIISKSIQDQPAPFIYERLGERYRDYFIDEFQDTSELQWNNLIPLIDNAVATETLEGKRGKVTIVGDAKQAIYRWRGGKAAQFIKLSTDQNPFSVNQKQVLNLPKNYRSHEEIIEFNNSFFTFLSTKLSDPIHKALYVDGNNQETNSKKGGYVQISFVEAATVADEHEIYPQKVYETVIELHNKGYTSKDICIIVRKQKQGIAIADFLTDKGLSIISSETLLINNAPEVRFIIDLISWFVQPTNLLAKVNMLQFISKKVPKEEKHTFLQKMMITTRGEFLSELRQFNIIFDFEQLTLLPFYDAIEYIIGSFSLAKKTPVYIQFFLDVIFSFTQRNAEGMVGFLDYWESKKDTLSIVAPNTEDAIQIMTIHKAKGLEFPCVIYPYANEDIYREIEPKTWLSIDKDNYLGFEETFIDYSKSIEQYSQQAQQIVAKRQAQLELDVFNLQYVAFTRAKEQLYIISKWDVKSNGESNSNKFSGKIIEYLKNIGKWAAENRIYTFGNPIKPKKKTSETKNPKSILKLSHFEDPSATYNVHIITNSGKLWGTTQMDAIEKGNLIHSLMASIYTFEDIPSVLEKSFLSGEITLFQKETLANEITQLINHPELSPYYSTANTVYNERDIIYEGRFFRPDRIIIEPQGKTTIIDYKTNMYKDTHAKQIQQYAAILERMGHIIKHKILVYINEKITLKYV